MTQACYFPSGSILPPMSKTSWHLVRAGRPQIMGDKRLLNGDTFLFLPLFRSHREADYFCRQAGLWAQDIRPRQHHLAAGHSATEATGVRALAHAAREEGVNVVGVFIGFNSNRESCWDYFRVTTELNALPHLLPLTEDERPV